MYIIIAIIILAVLYYYFVMVKNGNLAFWKKAGKNPDFVYEQLSKDDAWLIDGDSNQKDKSGYDGPFLLYVPSLEKTIKFYGKVGEYEDSQKKLGNNYKNDFILNACSPKLLVRFDGGLRQLYRLHSLRNSRYAETLGEKYLPINTLWLNQQN